MNDAKIEQLKMIQTRQSGKTILGDNIRSIMDKITRDKMTEGLYSIDSDSYTSGGLRGAVTALSPRYEEAEEYSNDKYIVRIVDLRKRLEQFTDGSNQLIKMMHPQTIRETIRGIRKDVEKLKEECDITELDIIKYLEDEEDRIADKKSKEDYDVPF